MDRFWAHVAVRGDDECWPWHGSTTQNRYGVPTYGRFTAAPGEVLCAHRVAYLLENGDLGTDDEVCHSCDNPPCCNPRHLWKGSRQENQRDKASKGRAASTGPRTPVRGEAQHLARLDADRVREMRRLATEGWSYNRLAARFAVAKPTVECVIKRRTWKHVA